MIFEEKKKLVAGNAVGLEWRLGWEVQSNEDAD